MLKGWQTSLGPKAGSQLLITQKKTDTKEVNCRVVTNLYSLCCQQRGQGRGRRRLWKIDTMGFNLWGFGGALPAQEVSCRNYLLQWEGAVIHSISWRHWSGHSDRRGPEGNAFYPPCQQIVHKPGLAFCTSGRSCLADYFLNGAPLGQGEIQSEKTKQEQQNNLEKKKVMILCRMIHISGSYPHHHHIWCPHKPTIPWCQIVHAALATL